jgi:hypothetical protein
MSMKNSSDTIRNQTCDLLACSAVPQPTALPGAPYAYVQTLKQMVHRKKFKVSRSVKNFCMLKKIVLYDWTINFLFDKLTPTLKIQLFLTPKLLLKPVM